MTSDTDPPITANDIDALIEIFETSDWDEMHLQIGGVELFLSTDPNAAPAGAAAPAPAAVAPGPAAAAPVPSAPAPSMPVHDAPEHWLAITAPNLGTFYRAPKPGAPPLVEEGQSVEAETELCLIEVMKLFTALRAGAAGTVRRICVSDGDMVEHGQTLFYLEPA